MAIDVLHQRDHSSNDQCQHRQSQIEEMDTSRPITLIGLSHCCPDESGSSPVITRSSATRAPSTRLRASNSSPSWTCKSPVTSRRQWWSSPSSRTITHALLLLVLATSTVIANTASGLEAKNDWSIGGHHGHHASHQSSAASAAASSSSKSIGKRPRYRTLYACEGSSLEIACEEGTNINLIRANFGRFSISVCNEHGNVEWSVDCMSRRSFKVIEERCAGRSKCSLEASVSALGEDACPRVHKYLEVHFNCTAPGFRPSVPAGAMPPMSLSTSDNHSHEPGAIVNGNSPNPRHNPLVTIPPLVIFPEPLPPSGSEHSKHSVSTTSTIAPPGYLDLSANGNREFEDIDDDAFNGQMGSSSTLNSGHFSGGGIIVKPPTPLDDYPTNSKTPDDDADLEDPDGSDEEPEEPKQPEYGQKVSTSTEAPSQSNNNHFQNPQPSFVVPPQAPTAKPPKPELNNAFTSPPSSHQGHQYDDPHDDSELITVTVSPPMLPLELIYDHCHPMYAKGLNWNWTLAGSVAMQPCPDGAEGMSRWACNSEGGMPTWRPHLPDMSNCSSLWVTHLVTRIRSRHESMFTLAEELAKGAKGKKMYSGDLIRAADIVKQLVTRLETYLEETKEDQDRRANVIKELLNSVLNVASNLLEEIQMESWHELSTQDQRLAIGSMTGALESVAQMLADVRSQPNYNYVRTHNNILVSVHVHALSALENGMRLPLVLSQHETPSMSDSAPNEVTAYLPYEALVEHANDNGQVKVVFMMYRRLASLLKPNHPSSSYENNSPTHLTPYAYQHYQSPERASDPFDSYISPHQRGQPGPHRFHEQSPVNTIVNSDVVGLIIASDLHRSSYDRLSTPLSAPLELTLRHLQVDNVTNGRCAFWDIKRSDWSTAGCETVSSNQTHTVCRCNHLTNFAVLMDISNVPFNPSDEFALKLITRIGCGISILCLALTLLTLSVYRSLKSIRNSIHKHLCACLLVAEIIFLFGIDETRVKLICGLIAIALHYFFLSAFLWMFFEGLQLYTMLVQVFEHRPNRLTFYTLVAYGAPALLVIVAALVDPLSYGTADHCWLRADNHFVWSFLGPALAVLLANALFLAMAMSVMCRHSPTGMMSSASFAVHQKQQQQQQQLKVYPSPLTSSPSYSIAEHSKYTSIRVWVRTSFALVVVLGLTWTFGVLYLSRSTVYMAYIFTLLNSLQGLFIFIFCCLLNEKVRAEYRTTLARGARRCFLLRPFEPSSLAFATKSSTDSTRSTSIRDSHHLMMAANSPHHLSQQHLYMQQPAASFLGSRNAGPRTSLLYLNELLGKQSEAPTAASTPTADQPLITSQMMQQAPMHGHSMSQAQSTLGLDQHNLNSLQQTQLSAALAGLSQIQLPDDASNSDYGCRRLTQMIEHIYECIDEDPYVAKLLLPAIERSLTNHQVRAQLAGRGQPTMDRQTQLPPQIMATLGRASHRDISQHMRLQPNSSYLSSGNPNHHTLHGAISSMHLPAIVRDNTANGKVLPNGVSTGALNGYTHGMPQSQQTVALLDGDQVRCCTLTDHKLCDHQSDHQMNGIVNGGMPHHMMKMANGRHHLASEC